jgi:hypothetical protein
VVLHFWVVGTLQAFKALFCWAVGLPFSVVFNCFLSGLLDHSGFLGLGLGNILIGRASDVFGWAWNTVCFFLNLWFSCLILFRLPLFLSQELQLSPCFC